MSCIRQLRKRLPVFGGGVCVCVRCKKDFFKEITKNPKLCEMPGGVSCWRKGGGRGPCIRRIV